MSATPRYPFDVVRGARDVVLVAFPATWLGFELDESDGNPATAERPETGRQVLARMPRVVALLDGAMFELPGGGTDYAHASGARLLYRYLDRRRGIDRPTRYPDRGATLSVTPDGHATMMDGAREVIGATFAAQGYPEVIRAGRVEASAERNTDAVGRAALCLLDDGRVAFAVGRASMRAFGEALLGLSGVRVRDAVYTDGGGSTTLALRGEGGGLVIAHGLDARRLPVYLLAEPPSMGEGMVGAPSGSGSSSSSRVGPVLKVLGGTAAVVALAVGVRHWWESRREDAPPAVD